MTGPPAIVVDARRATGRVPPHLMFSLTMPLAMLVLFSQVFRSVADTPSFPAGVSYIDYLTPAMLAVTTVMAGSTAMAGTTAMAGSTAMPMPQGLADMTGTGAEMLVTVARAAILLAGATLLGFRFRGGPLDAVAGLLVLVVLAAAMSALFGRIGDRLRRVDVAPFAGTTVMMVVMMPVVFVSGAFAPLETMPGWMGTLASLNPVAHAADALRGNALGTARLGDTVAALAAAAGMWIAVTTRWGRRPTSRGTIAGGPAT